MSGDRIKNDGSNFSNKAKLAAAAALFTAAAVGGVGAMSGCNANRAESGSAEINNLLEQEQEIASKNARFMEDNSKLAVYIVKNGDGENDIYYATGWVGQKHAAGNNEQEYDLGEISSVLKSMPSNDKVNFENLEPGMKVTILIKNTSE